MEHANRKHNDVQQYDIVLKQFKKSVADILKPTDTDAVLLKGLKARNFNVKRAEQYFREMHSIKQTYNLENPCETYEMPQVAEEFGYTAFLGYAKDGTIVRYTPLGRGDHYGMIQSLTPFQLGVYATYIMEEDLNRQRLKNKETGEDIHEVTYIFDLTRLSIPEIMHKAVYEIGIDLMYLVQEYYPEIWGNIFLINVPPYFDTLFNMFKPIMRMNVIEKLQVVSRESVPEVLLKYVDADVLPQFLGGTRVDSSGDPKCAEFLRFGGKIPRQYYIINQPPLMMGEPGVMSKWVGPRTYFNYSVVVRQPNSRISIEIRTESGSIHLCILHRKFGPNYEIDIPKEAEYLDEKNEKYRVRKVSPGMRIQSHLAQANDINRAPLPGIYIFRFNNSHNWLYSRRVIFRIKAIENES